MITYRDVLNRLLEATNDELQQHAKVRFGGDEFTSVIEIGVSCKGNPADGILDKGHLYFDIHGGI